MNKQEFLGAVESKISGLSRNDIDKSLDYYSEMIDDRIEDGLPEEDAVAAMGSIDDIAAQILMDTPFPKLVKAKVSPTRRLRAWEIVLLVLGSPIWLSLLVAFLVIFLAVYIVIWTLVLVLYAVDLSVAAVAFAGVACGSLFVMTGEHPQGLFLIGAGFLCAGIAILLFLLSRKVTVGIAKLSKHIVFWIKSLFVKKGEEK